jgi:hypothetical protein
MLCVITPAFQVLCKIFNLCPEDYFPGNRANVELQIHVSPCKESERLSRRISASK